MGAGFLLDLYRSCSLGSVWKLLSWICIEAAALCEKDPWTLRFVDNTGFVTSRPKDFNMKSAAVGNPQDASQWQRIDAPISVMFPPFKAHIKSGKKCPLRNLKCW